MAPHCTDSSLKRFAHPADPTVALVVDEATPASDAVLILFNALPQSEQEEVVFERISELRLRQLAGGPQAPSLLTDI